MKRRRVEHGSEHGGKVVLSLRVSDGDGEHDVVARVRPDAVDLSAHAGLVALPEGLRACAAQVRVLVVVSHQLQELPAWLGELGGLEELRVGGEDWGNPCPLAAVPAAVGALTRLQTLHVRHCPEITVLPAALSALKGLQDLDLSGCCGLEEVPAWVMDLPQLAVPFTELRVRVKDKDGREREMAARVRPDAVDLSAHAGLVALPEGLRACAARVRALVVVSHQLQELPAWLGELEGLEELRVGANEDNPCPITALPAAVGALTRLQTLDLSDCGAMTALPEGLSALTCLQTLHMAYCGALTALPAGLSALTGLQTLRLFRCQALAALPAGLSALTCLHALDLRGCWALAALPAGLSALTGLQTLDLSGCGALTALPAGFSALTGLQTLTLGGNGWLTALPAWLLGMTKLQALDLSHCGALTVLPAGLSALTGLQTLDLRANDWLTELPDWLLGMTNLQTLDLSYCRALTALPAGLSAHTQMQTLNLSGCRALHTPPPHVAAAGTRAVLQFLRDLAKGDAVSHLAKLVLLGDQTVGKSSLADSLALGRPAVRPARDRTVGIDVRRWRVGGGSPLVVNVYDAAGHCVYRATHGLFMSEDALFLHVARSDATEDAAVAALLEWIEAVQQEAPGATMGVVWTHVDRLPDYTCVGAGWCQGFVRVASGGGISAAAAAAGSKSGQWAVVWCRQQRGAPCAILEGVGMAAVPSGLRWCCVGADTPLADEAREFEISNDKLAGALAGQTAFTPREWAAFGIDFLPSRAWIKVGDAYFQPVRLAGGGSRDASGQGGSGDRQVGEGEESMCGRVAVLDCRLHYVDPDAINKDIQNAIPELTHEGAAGVMVILSDDALAADDEGRLSGILDNISAAPPFTIMIVSANEARILAARGSTIDVFAGAWQSACSWGVCLTQ